MAIDYQEMLDEIIQAIKDDDTANSETIAGMVERLQELNSLGQAQFLAREINTGTGLVGGGDLSQDRELSLAEWVTDALSRADYALPEAELEDRLEPYLTLQVAAELYATKQEARQVSYLPFSYPGTLNGETTSPQIALPVAGRISHLSVAVKQGGSAVTVELLGGAEGSVTLGAGQTSTSVEVDSAVNGPVRVEITSSSAEDVVVTLRVVEGE